MPSLNCAALTEELNSLQGAVRRPLNSIDTGSSSSRRKRAQYRHTAVVTTRSLCRRYSPNKTKPMERHNNRGQ